MTRKRPLNFDLLWDEGNAYSRRLGLVFAVPEEHRAVYRAFGIDLAEHNGDDNWELPMPARLVVDSGGVIRAIDVDPDYKNRPEPAKSVDDLKALAL